MGKLLCSQCSKSSSEHPFPPGDHTRRGRKVLITAGRGQQTVFYIVYLRELYRKIGTTFGSDEPLEHLNLLFCQRFLIVTPMDGFLRGLTNDLLYSLASQHVQTSGLAVQLWLNRD